MFIKVSPKQKFFQIIDKVLLLPNTNHRLRMGPMHSGEKICPVYIHNSVECILHHKMKRKTMKLYINVISRRLGRTKT